MPGSIRVTRRVLLGERVQNLSSNGLGITGMRTSQDANKIKTVCSVRKNASLENKRGVEERDLLLFDNWMTVSEFAEHFKFSVSYVYQLFKEGLPYLPSVGASARKGARRIPVRKASEWLEKRIIKS